jgi:hypothetical protein
MAHRHRNRVSGPSAQRVLLPVPGELHKDKHWFVMRDNCPREELCPVARLIKDMDCGNLHVTAHVCRQPFLDPPPEHWVLEQGPQDPIGHVAGRANTDIFRPGKCLGCDGFEMLEQNEVTIN